jgi:hypothetical protein
MITALLTPLQVLLEPVGSIPRAVEQRRWLAPMLLVALLTALAGVAVSSKLDMARVVLPKLQMAGELGNATEREVEEAIEQAQRVAVVVSVARGVFLTPLWLLALSVALKLSGWLLGRRATFVACFTAAALAMLPVALLHGIELVAALRQDVLSPKMAEVLVPTSLAALRPGGPPGMARILGALDVINLWSALLLGLGFAGASKWSPWKGAALGVFLYALFAGAFLVGVPGLMAGSMGPGMGGG